MDWLLYPALDYTISQELFLRGLALTYFIAFWSLLKQVKGLYGAKGITPISELLQGLRQKNGGKPDLRAVTFFWINSSDTCLQWVCVCGMTAALLVFLGVISSLLFFLLWAFYLSFVSIGSVFLSFQWDTLLLETGFIAIFFSIQIPSPPIYVYLLWFLLFRFLFSSGVVKLLSRCPEWRSLKAMSYHFLTQPIPNRLAYYAHQYAQSFSKLYVSGVFVFELAVPFMIFGPSNLRLYAFCLMVFFQLFIFATGNFAFFNLLTIVLCLPLLNNNHLAWLKLSQPSTLAGSVDFYLAAALTVIGGGLLFLNILQLAGLFTYLRLSQRILWRISPLLLVNHYGLFARMTTVRNEIIIEGSMDGNQWKSYEFKWKPGDLFAPPKQVAPFHPRLDWQMWFAALDSWESNAWFCRFVALLLNGSLDVQALLKTNPFPQAPPKYIRTLLYEYHFSDLATKRTTGEWWTRKYKGNYSPIFSLRH